VTYVHSGAAGSLGGTALTVARAGFVSAFHTAALLGAVAMLIGAAGVVKWLPARAPDEAPAVDAVDLERDLDPDLDPDLEPEPAPQPEPEPEPILDPAFDVA
jgi:hypothetical protein